MKINEINIITSAGAKSYKVGIDDITRIEESAKQISPNDIINVFNVYSGNGLVAVVSANCPFEIVYGKVK